MRSSVDLIGFLVDLTTLGRLKWSHSRFPSPFCCKSLKVSGEALSSLDLEVSSSKLRFVKLRNSISTSEFFNLLN